MVIPPNDPLDKKLSRTRLERTRAAAARLALAMQADYPRYFLHTPVKASSIARVLGYRVKEVEKLAGRARIYLADSDEIEGRIEVERGLPAYAARFAVAHEIGHAVLWTAERLSYPTLSLEEKEAFAHRYASRLLVPKWKDAEVRKVSRKGSPEDIAMLAHNLGLSLAALLVFISAEKTFLSGSGIAWLLIRFAPNIYTATNPKYRIVAAAEDRDIMFVPRNVDIGKVLGKVDWIVSQQPGESATFDIAVTLPRRNVELSGKYKWITDKCNINIFSMRSVRNRAAPSHLVRLIPANDMTKRRQ